MPTQTKTIYDSLVKSGVYFWNADFSNHTIVLSDSLRYMLGFQQEILTFTELTNLLPEDFRVSLVNNINTATEWFLPVHCPTGIAWFDVHKIQEEVDIYGAHHVMGTAREMRSIEVSEKVAMKGLSVDAMSPLIRSLHMMSESSTFEDGAHLLLQTLQKQMIGVKIGILRWDGGKYFAMVDYVGGHIINAKGEIVGNNGYLHSEWLQSAAMNCTGLSIDANNKLKDQWAKETDFFRRNGGRSVIISPIVTDKGATWGLLCVVSSTRTMWSAFDKQWLEMASGWLGLCLKRMNLIAERDNQLSIVSQACVAGDLSTWSWDCVTGKRTCNEYGIDGVSTRVYNDQNIANEIHRNDINRLNKALYALRDGNLDEVRMNIRIRNKVTNKKEWCEMRGRVTSYSSDGKPLLVSGVMRNIEKDVQREQEEKTAQEFQNSVYNKMPAAIEFFNEEGNLVNLNETAIAMFGIQGKRSVLGINIYDNPNLTEEQRDLIRDNDNAVFSFTYDFSVVGDFYNTKRDDTIEVVYRMSKLYTKGVFAGYMVVVLDNSQVTSQARQIDIFQQYFLEIGSFAKIGVCWFTDTKNGYVSEQWNINLGIVPDAPYMRNLSLCVRVNKEDLEAYGVLLGRIFTGDIDSFQCELRVTHSDDMLHYIKVQFLRSKEVVTGISVDITQTKENEKMLITARSKAERADMLKSQFLANMSHEIRTPLNAIIGFSDLIVQSVDMPELKEYSDIIQANNELLLGIINDIIDLSQIESGTLEMLMGDNDINEIGREIYEEYDKKEHKKIEFFYTPCRTDMRAYCDKYHIKQVVGNLISNAYKFTASGRVHFSIENRDGYVVFNVSDTGCGIPGDQLERIFEPYVKLDTFSVGTGLGLSISKSLAEVMHGSIHVVSTEGRGSQFSLRVPYVRPEDAESYMEQQARSIMLLCNTSETTQFVQYSLDEYDLILEQDHVFMSLWLEKKPRLTIIDQQMFGDSIADVVSSLHSHGEEYRLVVICPSGVNIDTAAIEEAGASAIVPLPVTSEKFKSIVAPLI